MPPIQERVPATDIQSTKSQIFGKRPTADSKCPPANNVKFQGDCCDEENINFSQFHDYKGLVQPSRLQTGVNFPGKRYMHMAESRYGLAPSELRQDIENARLSQKT
ncbi:hypothetical protein PTTG_12140 [Puccinia triticina 1-1 BBBD Race 1]|uniref:Uncharacterized protein n=2 Tax=Puccinia triticina TaxID=208348 RepID=A0A180GS29_PUCT1|nr:uncharacterized protein PtA15_7A576 [Puccinia triticina]OAV95637.1 hypothetical protein PTTG_12140 [Puccinia triticina 1-1 BBBD Race 1]WAQ86847.1 hypothetical protein PtA15_7A576 [Puccinia triticina]WAR56716.1 hypothetical protein PtB15_7B566 [Puccinia triticina]